MIFFRSVQKLKQIATHLEFKMLGNPGGGGGGGGSGMFEDKKMVRSICTVLQQWRDGLMGRVGLRF